MADSKQAKKDQKAEDRPKRTRLRGVVVSDKMEKTIVVRVDRLVRHPLYKKTYRKSKKFKAHDEKNEAKVGDFVEIEACRPLSKEKHFRLVKIIERKEK